MRGYHATEAYQKAMRKRQVWVEPLFAEAKVWHALRRFRLRGLANANIQGLLIAAGQNVVRFLATTGWGHRHAPCGSPIGFATPARRLAAVRTGLAIPAELTPRPVGRGVSGRILQHTALLSGQVVWSERSGEVA